MNTHKLNVETGLYDRTWHFKMLPLGLALELIRFGFYKFPDVWNI